MKTLYRSTPLILANVMQKTRAIGLGRQKRTRGCTDVKGGLESSSCGRRAPSPGAVAMLSAGGKLVPAESHTQQVMCRGVKVRLTCPSPKTQD